MSQKPYRLGAIAYVLDGNSRLLLVQLNSYHKNEWNMPGGGRVEGEDANQNAVRELKEELDIRDSELELIGVSKDPLKYDFPPEMAQRGEPIALKYAGQKKDQVIFKSNITRDLEMDITEIRDYKWCSVEELKDHLVFPGQYDGTIAVLGEFDLF